MLGTLEEPSHGTARPHPTLWEVAMGLQVYLFKHPKTKTVTNYCWKLLEQVILSWNWSTTKLKQSLPTHIHTHTHIYNNTLTFYIQPLQVELGAIFQTYLSPHLSNHVSEGLGRVQQETVLLPTAHKQWTSVLTNGRVECVRHFRLTLITEWIRHGSTGTSLTIRYYTHQCCYNHIMIQIRTILMTTRKWITQSRAIEYQALPTLTQVQLAVKPYSAHYTHPL